MMSNNGLMTYKSKYLSFINKGTMALLFGLLLIVIVPCTCFMFVYWSEMPIFIRIFWPILLTVILIGIIVTPLNGMAITKNGTIFFVPDFRFKKLNVNELERMAFNFNEWENNKYSVTVKFVYKDGEVFAKDYSKQFRNMRNKKLAMSMYTIKKRRVDKICKKLSDLDNCVITIVDKNRNIVFQNK